MAHGLHAVERTRRRRRETRRPSDARVDGVAATRSREDAIAATAVRTASKTMHEDGVKGTPRAHDEARHVLGRRELREAAVERPRGQRLLVVESSS